MSPRVVVLLASAVLVMALGIPLNAHAQSAEQLKAFQSLPKEQRDAILQQVGAGRGGLPGAGTIGGTAGNNQNINVLQSPGGDTLEVQPDSEIDPVTRLPMPVRIRGGEQLLIELDFIGRSDRPDTTTEVMPDGRQVIREVKRPRLDPDLLTPDQRRRLIPEERKRIEELRDQIVRHNPYELSRYGVLQLPGLEPIPLAGLTQRQAQERLSAEPALRDLTVGITLLRLKPYGASALKPFGYDMFRGRPNAFVPGTDIPVASDYRVAAGDVLDVELFGQKSSTLSLPVTRDGTVSLPDIGPVNVGGLSFGSAKSTIEQMVGKQMIGTHARVTMSTLRATRVFVLGDSEHPGSYVLSGMSSVTAALFASGGVKEIGSLRNILIKRDGKLIRRLDLYDVLLNGNTENDVRLETGDVVFVPPLGLSVGIDGEVRRPAYYELDRERSLGELFALAGGLTPEADPRIVTVERINERHERTMISVDLGVPSGKSFTLRTGDIVRVAQIRPVLENSISIEGNAFRTGTRQFHPGMRLSDVITSVDDLKPRSDVHYLLVKRSDPATRRISVFSADLAAALAHPGGESDLRLAPRDTILVFDQTSDRGILIEPIMEELRRQGSPEVPATVVSVVGTVNAEGKYPLEPGMRVLDLLRAGGGLKDAAYGAEAELTRYSIEDGSQRTAKLYKVDLAKALAGEESANATLEPYDVLTIKKTPEWERVEKIEIAGEVRFPGVYQIRRGETLRSVMERAGGVTSTAFAEGAVFTRLELKKREREQLDQLALRLQSDIAAMSLQGAQTNPGSVQALSAGQGLLDQLRDAKPVGRLVIDLNEIMAGVEGGPGDVTLRDGDYLVVPRQTQEVSVLGEVQSPTSHLYKPHLTRDQVVALSGGTTSKADHKRIYIVRANGSVVGSGTGWTASSNVEVRPGDTVVVPLDAEKMRPLPLWTAVTTIIYNLAIAAAAIGRF